MGEPQVLELQITDSWRVLAMSSTLKSFCPSLSGRRAKVSKIRTSNQLTCQNLWQSNHARDKFRPQGISGEKQLVAIGRGKTRGAMSLSRCHFVMYLWIFLSSESRLMPSCKKCLTGTIGVHETITLSHCYGSTSILNPSAADTYHCISITEG